MCTANDMFKEAAIIQLTATCWHIDKILPVTLIDEKLNAEYIKVRKKILDPEALALVKEHAGKARNYLRGIALPFPINGCMLVPKKLIPQVEKELKALQWKYNSAVEDFIRWLPASIKDAKALLGELFDEMDYPTPEKAKRKFRFEWRYIVIGQVNSKVLPPSLYQEEVNKFRNLMEQARTEAIASLRGEFVDLIANLNDKLTGSPDGKPKRLRDAAVENLHQFLDQFQNRNMFKDDQLAELVERCRGIITGVSADNIRNSIHVKQELHNQMQSLLETIDATLEDLPRRKIRMAA